MSETNAGVEMERGKREIKLTTKTLENKIEKLQYDAKKWLNDSVETEQTNSLSQPDPATTNEQVFPCPAEDESHVPRAASIIMMKDIYDDTKSSDSVSNVGSKRSGKSAISTASSACLIAEADLAALMARQKLLKDKHELEQQEEYLRRKREQLELDEAVAAHTAKLNVLRSRSLLSGKRSSAVHSDGMNSYFEREKSKPAALNAAAKSFIPQMQVKYDYGDTGAKPKVKTGPQICDPASRDELRQCTVNNDNMPTHRECGSKHVDQNSMLDIMRKQNEITTLLIQQQCLSSLPKREIPIFDGEPLEYHAFMRAFENGVEGNTANHSDRLYFLEQYTRGLPKELVRSCHHLNPERGYAKAKALLHEHFGNEQRVAFAYMEKALSWPSIKTEDVKALQDYSLFLRGCSNAMEGVQYLHELDLPANMLTIVKKLPYKYRDKWRTVACELQERRNQRATFSDITDFIERLVKILTDPVFGNIQDVPPVAMYKGVKSQLRPGMKGASFATTVAQVENQTQHGTQQEEQTPSTVRMCLCCGGGHTLDACHQLEKRTHKEKIGFLREKGVCFGCLCIGHISRDCRNRISCAKCGLQHPSVLHIPPKQRDYEQSQTKSEIEVDSTLVSSGLTGAGDHDCKLPIVPVRVKSKKDGLPGKALQKIQEMESHLDKLKKERSQKQFQLDSLEAALQKQKRKVDSERGEISALKRENQSLVESCDSLEKARQKVIHDLGVKEQQVSYLEGQLNSCRKTIEQLEQELKKYKSELDRSQPAGSFSSSSELQSSSTPQKSFTTPGPAPAYRQQDNRLDELQEKYTQEVEERKRLENELKVLQVKVLNQSSVGVSHKDIAARQAGSSIFPWQQQDQALSRQSLAAMETPLKRRGMSLWDAHEQTPIKPSQWLSASMVMQSPSGSSQQMEQLKTLNQELRGRVSDLERNLSNQEKNCVTVLLDQSSRRLSQLEEEKKSLEQSFKRTQGLLDDLEAKSVMQVEELKKLQTKLEQQTETSARELENLKKTLSDAQSKTDRSENELQKQKQEAERLSNKPTVLEKEAQELKSSLSGSQKECTELKQQHQTLLEWKTEKETLINETEAVQKASTDPNDLEALTPNHLLLLKTLPSLPPRDCQEADGYARRRWKQVQYMSDLFWKRWRKEYLPQLQERQKWSRAKRNIILGDVVLIVDSTAPRNSWVMGRVLQIFPDRRGFVRQVRIDDCC